MEISGIMEKHVSLEEQCRKKQDTEGCLKNKYPVVENIVAQFSPAFLTFTKEVQYYNDF